jgi:hypothetical protein
MAPRFLIAPPVALPMAALARVVSRRPLGAAALLLPLSVVRGGRWGER